MEVERTAASSSDESVMLPKWFLYVASGCMSVFLALFVPWASWMSVTVLTLSVKIEEWQKVPPEMRQLKGEFDRYIIDSSHRDREISRRLEFLEQEAIDWGP